MPRGPASLRRVPRESTGWSVPGAAATYAETFALLCAGTFPAVIAESKVLQGGVTRVLDVGAGTGALAAQLVAAGGQVTAVDPDPAMLRLAGNAGPGIQVHLAGLPCLPFPDESFDAVVANFVVNHVQDPLAGMRELARVAGDGARVVTTIWPSGQNTQSRLWAAVIEAAGAVAPPSTRLPQDKDFPRTCAGLAALLDQAGLVDVTTRTVSWTHHAPPDALWRGAAAGIGGIGATVRSQSAGVRAAMKAEYDRLVADLTTEGGEVRLETEAILGAGTKSSGY